MRATKTLSSCGVCTDVSGRYDKPFEQLIISPPIVSRPDSAGHVDSASQFALDVALQIVLHMWSCSLGDIHRCRSSGSAPAAYASQIQVEEATDPRSDYVSLGKVLRDKKTTDDGEEIESWEQSAAFFPWFENYDKPN